MKRTELQAKCTELGIDSTKLSELIDYIMDTNGADINASKSKYEAQIQTLESDKSNLTTQITSLTADKDKYGDYETIKQELETYKSEQVKGKQVEYLKALGCNDPELVLGNVDWSKGTYNDEKKTFEGIEIDAFKKAHPRLFDEVNTENPKGSQPSPFDSMNDVEKAFYQNNPDLMPR